ncbi:GGDEF-domain containing protein [Hyphomicrobium sulfonivorans]|nr:GGDEF-domain containing protein [Hyphomicrobium sulfonivorans]
MASISRRKAVDTAAKRLHTDRSDTEPRQITRLRKNFDAQLADLSKRNSELERLNSSMEAAIDHMGRGLSMFDSEQRLLVCNKAYADVYMLPPELTAPGTPFIEILRYHLKQTAGADTSGKGAAEWIQDHIARLQIEGHVEEVQRLADGRVIRVSYRPLAGGGWVDMQEDITAQRRSDEKIEWLARHDTLTEIPNRFHFREHLTKQFATYDTRKGFALLWLDLDHFKDVNDQLGHLVGDGLLKSVADRLRSCLRAGDIVGRLGGDEFAILQCGADRPELAEALARRVLDRIRLPHEVAGHSLFTDVSIGIALAPTHGQTPEQLLASADLALYQAKSRGRGLHAVFCQQTMGTPASVLSPLRAELEHAVERSELVLHYQPIVDLQKGEVSCCEALMRWKHPSRGMIAPADFIPIAEETKLIVSMGKWALEQACSDALDWPASTKVAVNLSAVQIECGDIYETVTDVLAQTGLPPARLQLEITESVLMRDRARTQEVLRKLHDLGVMISLDDFGSCFATLSYLHSFPFRKIKLDRSFVRDIPQHRDCVTIVKSVADLARELEMHSVAEGVETAACLTTVRDAGYSEAQGFYFSPAVRASGVERALRLCAQRFSAATAPTDTQHIPNIYA